MKWTTLIFVIFSNVTLVVVDLSWPNQIWANLLHFVGAYNAWVLQCFQRIGTKSTENIRQNIISQWKCRIDENHPDKHALNIFSAPLIIIGNTWQHLYTSCYWLISKYKDKYCIDKALRFVTHYHAGAFVVCTYMNMINCTVYSVSDVFLSKRLWSYSNYIAFGTSKPNIFPVLKDEPLFILFWQDNFVSIGKIILFCCKSW